MRIRGAAFGALVMLAASHGADREAAKPAIERRARPTTTETQVRAAYVTARQAEGETDATYALAAVPGGATFVGGHASLRAEMSSRGATLSNAGEPWRVTLRGARVKCAGAATDLATVGGPRAGSGANRVEYTRQSGGAEIGEWYANGPLGVEQGFTLEADPCGATGDVVIDVKVEGLVPVADGAGVALKNEGGATCAHYTDLSAKDAGGRALGAAMGVEEGVIELRVATEGATFPVVVDPMMWTEASRLVANDGASTDNFGFAVAISGSTAFIGAPEKTVGSNAHQGAVYVFVGTGDTWTQQQILVANDGLANAQFGSQIALSGDTAIVGAGGFGYMQPTAAYAFVRSGGAWTLQQKLAASDGVAGDGFGVSVAISGTTAVVGANYAMIGTSASQGAAYVFVQQGDSWMEQQKLVASDGAANRVFGEAVAVSGSTALVAAVSSSSLGAAYVFTQTGGAWTQQQRLAASDGEAGDYFGGSLALDGNVALIGADAKTVGANAQQGAAYAFVQSGTTWTQQAKLVASDGAANDNFGISVALSGTTAFIGAHTKAVDSTFDQGAAYEFVQSGATWAQEQEIVGSDGAPGDTFGRSVALSGSTGLIGAPGKTIGANTDQGEAYVELGATTPSCSEGATCDAGGGGDSGAAFADASGEGDASGERDATDDEGVSSGSAGGCAVSSRGAGGTAWCIAIAALAARGVGV
jgi:hypothetical protein